MTAAQVRPLGALSHDSALGQRWEYLVQSNQASGVMQSLAWAQMKRRQGLASQHFGIFEGGELVGGALFYTSKRLNGAGILVAPEGPVLPWNDHNCSTQYLRLLTEECQTYAMNNGIMCMRIEPRLSPPLPALFREFGRAPVDLVPRETLYVDLRRSEEEILAQMKPKGRYNIKIAAKHGVEITEFTGAAYSKDPANPDSVQQFYDAMAQASLRDGFALESRSFFEHLTAGLLPTKTATILLAKHEDDLLGALLLITYGWRATYLYGGVTNIKRNLMGGYALQWEAMRKARAAGCETYDFYGYVHHRSLEHQYGRFSQFKSQFGGTPKRFFGAHDYFFIENLADAFVKAANEIEKSRELVAR